MKRELEDLAFPYVDPDAASHVAEVRKLKTQETEDGLAMVQKELGRELAKKGMKNIPYRCPHERSLELHQKLKRKRDDITLIHDIAALRIIVPTVEDCYTTLGTAHALYRPIPGEFKDYIAFPKPNGYQSLHTTVVTPDAGIVEIQIRTECIVARSSASRRTCHISSLGKESRNSEKKFRKADFLRCPSRGSVHLSLRS